MTDRRRINGPAGGTAPPVYASTITDPASHHRPVRTRDLNQLRKIFLQTGLTPSASGSAYLELEQDAKQEPSESIIPTRSTLKLTCTVHGPRPLPRSAPFSPQLVLSTYVKFAPFATRTRRGYIRDAQERDLGVHLEAALRGVIIGDRWPKSGVEIVVTVLEAEEDGWWGDTMDTEGRRSGIGGCGLMSVLAGCITVASAAIAEAGIDCVDLVTGGVAACVRNTPRIRGPPEQLVLDPCPSEHEEIIAATVVAYLASRDEITELWSKGDAGSYAEELIDKAVQAAANTRSVLDTAVKESVLRRLAIPEAHAPTESTSQKQKGKGKAVDIEMTE